jgi:hypothetical protein
MNVKIIVFLYVTPYNLAVGASNLEEFAASIFWLKE